MDMHDSILTLGFSEEFNTSIVAVRACCHSLLLSSFTSDPHTNTPTHPLCSSLQMFMEHRDELRRILDSTAVAVPTYADLHWRIDAQVASRTLRHHVQPTVSIKLDMKNAGMHACVNL